MTQPQSPQTPEPPEEWTFWQYFLVSLSIIMGVVVMCAGLLLTL